MEWKLKKVQEEEKMPPGNSEWQPSIWCLRHWWPTPTARTNATAQRWKWQGVIAFISQHSPTQPIDHSLTCCPLFHYHPLTQSLSLTQSLTHFLTNSLNDCHWLTIILVFFTHSITVTDSLSFLSFSLTHSLTHTLTHSLTQTLSLTVSLSLPGGHSHQSEQLRPLVMQHNHPLVQWHQHLKEQCLQLKNSS